MEDAGEVVAERDAGRVRRRSRTGSALVHHILRQNSSVDAHRLSGDHDAIQHCAADVGCLTSAARGSFGVGPPVPGVAGRGRRTGGAPSSANISGVSETFGNKFDAGAATDPHR